jgi:hypothetical protein
MKPAPWSPSSLSDFINCPSSYAARRVFKTHKATFGQEAEYGTWVHKQFENRQKFKTSLPTDLETHEQYMCSLEDLHGTQYTELDCGISKTMQPCGFWDEDVWMRQKIDWHIVNKGYCKVVDYKTGKKKEEPRQLMINALWLFLKYPMVEIVDSSFYWTVDETTTKFVWDRKRLDSYWAQLMPDLKQYKEAYLTDTWQPRQSGLCAGWCAKTDCPFWKEKRKK